MGNFDLIKKEYDFEFSKNTTYGLGGKVEVAYFPSTEEEAVCAFDFVNNNYEKFTILGNGSNVLVSDNDYLGAVICTKYLNKISHTDDVLRCQSGVTVSNLLSYCIKNGITGLEYLAGIPASIGGLALMNGGINARRIGEDILSVRIFDGTIFELSNKTCNFGNKHSTMRNINCIILSVDIKISYADSDTVEANVKRYKQLRLGQPKGKSCGCVFKNPEGFSAGKLIDEAGLKGFQYGNASVSANHANFIINNGHCADDVFRLISIVKQKVYEVFGILLEEEVIYIGEFNDFDS